MDPLSPFIPQRKGKLVVFSGGSAANNLVDVFRGVSDAKECPLSYIIPISDNGGSSSELIRVFGGPGIGDIRSRMVRLIPASPTTSHIKALFNHRLPSSSGTAKAEWASIVDGTSTLWNAIPSEKRELIRSFLVFLQLEILKRSRPPNNVFNFQSASVGNMFLTGVRLMTGSFEAAIYLLGAISGVNGSDVEVLPAINSNFSHHISAGLVDGSYITGQNAISHPSAPTALPATASAAGDATLIGAGITRPNTPTPFLVIGGTSSSTSHFVSSTGFNTPVSDVTEEDQIEDANPPSSLASLRASQIAFSKVQDQDLPSRICRIWYINPYGTEIRPPANPKVLQTLKSAHSIIYSIGSLYTSIIPCLVLRGVGDAISNPNIEQKVLILNGSIDRETGPSNHPFTATDFVRAVGDACAESKSGSGSKCADGDLSQYVTHVLHLSGPGVPITDSAELKNLGIECIRIYGRKMEAGGMRYDSKALGQTLEAILGKREKPDKWRRMTIDS